MDERREPIGDDEVDAANGLLADEMDRILGSRAAVSRSAIDRVTRLADQVRPGARARAQLSDLDPSRALAGTKIWTARNRKRSANTASRRAASRWSDQASS